MKKTTKQFNINELLERKKELEEQIGETAEIDPSSLIYEKHEITDHTNPKNSKTRVMRERVGLNGYTRKFNRLVEELAKVKTAIQEYNTNNVLGLIHQREQLRNKHSNLKRVLDNLKTEKSVKRGASRVGKENEPLETTEITLEPMFQREEVEKMMNEVAAQERKVNTEIQKRNLNARITL